MITNAERLDIAQKALIDALRSLVQTYSETEKRISGAFDRAFCFQLGVGEAIAGATPGERRLMAEGKMIQAKISAARAKAKYMQACLDEVEGRIAAKVSGAEAE